jgi:hypothetical protein
MLNTATQFVKRHAKILIASCLVMILGSGIGALKWLLDQNDRATSLLQSADQQFEAGNMEEALRLYQQAALLKEKSREIQTKIELTKAKLIGSQNSQQTAPKQEQPANANQGTAAQQPNSASKEIPNLIGLTLQEAEQLLLARSISYQYFIEPSNTEKGKVFKQDLEPGKSYHPGQRVTFYVSQ